MIVPNPFPAIQSSDIAASTAMESEEISQIWQRSSYSLASQRIGCQISPTFQHVDKGGLPRHGPA